MRVPEATVSSQGLQQLLWANRRREKPPLALDGRRIPLLKESDHYRTSNTGVRHPVALLGETFSLANKPAAATLRRINMANIAIMGGLGDDERRIAENLMGSAAISLARQHEKGSATFNLVNLQPDSEVAVRAIRAELKGHKVHLFDEDDYSEFLQGLAERAKGRAVSGKEYLLLFGAEQLNETFEDAGAWAVSSPQGESFRASVASGPANNIHTIGWWIDPYSLSVSVGAKAGIRQFGTWVALRDVPESSLVDGSFVSRNTLESSWGINRELWRMVYYDRIRSTKPQVAIPYKSLTD